MLIKPKRKTDIASKKNTTIKKFVIAGIVIGILIFSTVLFYKFIIPRNIYTIVSYSQYEKMLNEDKIASAVILKTGITDYYFNATLISEEPYTAEGKTLQMKRFSVFLPEPIIRDQEQLWKIKGIIYTYEED